MPLSKQEQFFVHEFSEEEVSIATTERSSFSARGGGGGGPSRVANLVEVEEDDSSVTVPENEPANTSLGDRGTGLRRSQERGSNELLKGFQKFRCHNRQISQ